MLPINIIGLSFNLAFVVIPILNGWFYPQKIVALAGWDGDAVEDEEESPRDETEMELVDETEIVWNGEGDNGDGDGNVYV